MAAMKINSKQLKEMLENKKTVLVDFWAPWCPHCLKINPAYEQIAQQYAGVLDVVKVDMDEDDYAKINSFAQKGCPYYHPGDEYTIVRKQN